MLRSLAALVAVSAGVVPCPPAHAGRDDLKGRLDAVTVEKYDADVVVVLDHTDVTVQSNGIGESTSRVVTKVLREGGIRGQSVRQFDFDPTTNRLEVNAVRIHRADGRVEFLPPASAAIQPNPQGIIFWASNQVLIDLPRLDVGDAVETVVTKTGFNVAYLASGAAAPAAFGPTVGELVPPMPGHWYDEVSFWTGVPVVEKRYTVRVPRDMRIQYGVYNGELTSSVTFDGDFVVYSFEKRDMKPRRGEPRDPSARDTDCKLGLATLEDWEQKSRWFYAANESSFDACDEIRAKVREVISGCETDEEKITALNHWVAENIRYVGTSRGACEGYTTHPVQETFRDRGGVCKDKAGLLVAMLREAGFDSYIVMTQAGTDVAPVPADQFNHAVTCIRNPDGTFRLLDPTWMPKSRENWSSAEQLQYVVYGTPEGQPLSLSPYSGPEENVVTWEADSRLARDGTLTAALKLTATGAPETALRRSLAGRHPGERPAQIDEWMQDLGPTTRVVAARAMDPVDFSGPITLSIDAQTDAYALGDGERLWLRLPMLRRVMSDVVTNDLHDSFGLEKRTLPVRLRSTRRMVIRETLRVPEGFQVQDLPESVELDGPAASLTFTIAQTLGQIEYTCSVDLKHRTIPVEDYANYKQVLETLRGLGDRHVVCTAETASARR